MILSFVAMTISFLAEKHLHRRTKKVLEREYAQHALTKQKLKQAHETVFAALAKRQGDVPGSSPQS